MDDRPLAAAIAAGMGENPRTGPTKAEDVPKAIAMAIATSTAPAAAAATVAGAASIAGRGRVATARLTASTDLLLEEEAQEGLVLRAGIAEIVAGIRLAGIARGGRLFAGRAGVAGIALLVEKLAQQARLLRTGIAGITGVRAATVTSQRQRIAGGQDRHDRPSTETLHYGHLLTAGASTTALWCRVNVPVSKWSPGCGSTFLVLPEIGPCSTLRPVTLARVAGSVAELLCRSTQTRPFLPWDLRKKLLSPVTWPALWQNTAGTDRSRLPVQQARTVVKQWRRPGFFPALA